MFAQDCHMNCNRHDCTSLRAIRCTDVVCKNSCSYLASSGAWLFLIWSAKGPDLLQVQEDDQSSLPMPLVASLDTVPVTCCVPLHVLYDMESLGNRVSHTRTHTHTPTHPHTQTHTRTHPPTHTHKHTHAHTRTHTRTHTHTHTDTHGHTRTHTHTHAHTRTHTHTHAHTRTHTHTRSHTHTRTHAHLHKHKYVYAGSHVYSIQMHLCSHVMQVAQNRSHLCVRPFKKKTARRLLQFGKTR